MISTTRLPQILSWREIWQERSQKKQQWNNLPVTDKSCQALSMILVNSSFCTEKKLGIFEKIGGIGIINYGFLGSFGPPSCLVNPFQRMRLCHYLEFLTYLTIQCTSGMLCSFGLDCVHGTYMWPLNIFFSNNYCPGLIKIKITNHINCLATRKNWHVQWTSVCSFSFTETDKTEKMLLGHDSYMYWLWWSNWKDFPVNYARILYGLHSFWRT